MKNRIIKKLVSGDLEGISSKVFDLYHDEITKLVGVRHGVYALYKKGRLYYVGLATDLKRRVKHHLEDKHSNKWDSFNLYLIKNVNYLKELETLIVHIARPQGNIQLGQFAGSQKLIEELSRLMETRDRNQRYEILKGNPRKKETHKKHSKQKKSINQAVKLHTGIHLQANYKGNIYTAVVTANGIKVGDKLFSSVSLAGSYVRGDKSTNGWTFWKYKNKQGEWKKIDELRK